MGGALSFIAAQHAGVSAAAPFYGVMQSLLFDTIVVMRFLLTSGRIPTQLSNISLPYSDDGIHLTSINPVKIFPCS